MYFMYFFFRRKQQVSSFQQQDRVVIVFLLKHIKLRERAVFQILFRMMKSKSAKNDVRDLKFSSFVYKVV